MFLWYPIISFFMLSLVRQVVYLILQQTFELYVKILLLVHLVQKFHVFLVELLTLGPEFEYGPHFDFV
jgi:hypothetical protein